METHAVLDIINKVLPGVSTKGIVEGMDTLVFQDDYVYSYNDKISISYPVPEDEISNCSVLASDFYKVVKGIKDDEVQIEVTDDLMKITSKDTDADIALKDSEKISGLIDALELDGLTFEPLPGKFLQGLSLCRFSASDNMNDDRFLFCVCCKGNHIISSDAYRISVFDLGEEMDTVLIPKGAIKDILRVKPDSYCVLDGWIHFENEAGAIMSCRCVENDGTNFDKYRKSFKGVKGKKVKLPKELKERMDDVVGFSDDVLAVQKNVRLSLGDNLLTCTISKVGGNLTKKMKVKSNVEADFIISGAFLQEVMDHTTTLKVGNGVAMLEQNNYKHLISLPVE